MDNASNPSEFGMVMVTAPSKEQAIAISQTLIHEKLAACVSLFPVHSIYTWNGAVQTDEEWQLLIKSALSKFPAIEAKVREIHPYEVPEILALPILQGSAPYLQWMTETLQT